MKAKIVMLTPHPDDECITGLFPLRLQRECGFKVEVWPLTLGSLLSRREERKRELLAACGALGWTVRFLQSPGGEAAKPEALAEALVEVRPAAVFLPHALDGHPTHRLAHRRGREAMDLAGGAWQALETEYWHPLRRPNVMVEASEEDLCRLRGALELHRGEVARNDYAARLAAWMSDNVRRGAELIGGPGAAAPAMGYATLYRWRQRCGGAWKDAAAGRIRIPIAGAEMQIFAEELRAVREL